MKKTKNKKRDAQKKRSGHEVRAVLGMSVKLQPKTTGYTIRVIARFSRLRSMCCYFASESGGEVL